MTLDTTAKNAGIADAQQCADSSGPTWTEAALHALTQYANLATQPFTTETAREWIGDLIPAPKDARAQRRPRMGRRHCQGGAHAPAVPGRLRPCPQQQRRTQAHLPGGLT